MNGFRAKLLEVLATNNFFFKMSTKKKQEKAMNEQSLNTFTDIVDNSISNLNADIQNKLDIKLSTLKDGLKQEFCESLNFLKTDILERLLADNKKLRKRLSWIEEEIENLYAHIYDLEIAVQGNNQQPLAK